MREVMLVAVGGSLGAVARYGLGLAAASLLGKGFPWGTLAVNVLGCFIMGMVMEVIFGLEAHTAVGFTPDVKLQLAVWHKGVAIGFLGGLTTFSTFSADTLRAFEAGSHLIGLANVAANLLLTLAAVWLGVLVMRAID
jgi:CrcB protein